jgi:hypothetical protein
MLLRERQTSIIITNFGCFCYIINKKLLIATAHQVTFNYRYYMGVLIYTAPSRQSIYTFLEIHNKHSGTGSSISSIIQSFRQRHTSPITSALTIQTPQNPIKRRISKCNQANRGVHERTRQ